MFAFYLKILGLNLAINNLVLLMASVVRGGSLKTGDFILPNAILLLAVTLIFISLDLFGAERDEPFRDRMGRMAVKQDLGRFKSSALQLSDKE